MDGKKAIQSKTIVGNGLVAAVFTILRWQGVDIPEDVVVSFLTLGNIFLRLMTNEAVTSR
jgi:hypothetical protein